jgi:hypothetical protein
MDRTLKVKRIFTMGQFQNIELADEVTGIPTELALNEDFIGTLSRLQLLNIERRINLYYQLREKYREASPEEAIALIEAEIADTKQALYAYMNPTVGE